MMQKLRAPTWQDIFLLIALLLLALELATGIAQYASLAGSAIRFPFPLDYGEGPVLDQTMKLAQGINPYQPDINTPPYNIANYPPLFQLLQVPFALAVMVPREMKIALVPILKLKPRCYPIKRAVSSSVCGMRVAGSPWQVTG